MTADTRPLQVLLVDDSEEDRQLYRRLLTRWSNRQYELVDASSARDGLDQCHRRRPDCILLDYQLPGDDGLSFLDELASEFGAQTVPVVMLTGRGNESIAVEAMKRGAHDYLCKSGLSLDGLHRAIDNAIEKVQLHEQLRTTNQILEKQNQRLTELYTTAHEFVDNVSHEFRTPLAVIKEFASIIRDGLAGEVSGEQREYLDIVANRVDDLEVMVNDMLDISRLEAGLLGVFRRSCGVGDITGHIADTLHRKASTEKIRLTFEIEENLPTVYCDPEKVGRVIINLTTNAIKFSEAGQTVRIWARRHDDSLVMIGVTDRGPGIAPENVETIFERFRQLDGQATAMTKGFGLGLNIARQIVHLSFGDIQVESKVGEGSTFSFTIPVADPLRFLPLYLRQIRRLREESPTVTLMTVQSSEPCDGETCEDLEQFLQHQIRRTDLLFQIATGTWLLVAPNNDPDLTSLRRRIEESWREANNNRPTRALPHITMTMNGNWRTADQAAEFIDRFQQLCPIGDPASCHENQSSCSSTTIETSFAGLRSG